jgi:hypothetical protein
MEHFVTQQKATITDGAVVIGGGVYAGLSDSLPIVIGVLTAVLLSFRILLAFQEYKNNKKKASKK